MSHTRPAHSCYVGKQIVQAAGYFAVRDMCGVCLLYNVSCPPSTTGFCPVLAATAIMTVAVTLLQL